MPYEEWELLPFQFAAEQMCFRRSQQPHEVIFCPDGSYRPRWTIYAERMLEHVEMVGILRNLGLAP